MKRLSVRTPTRIDLSGGTLDIYPMFRLLEKPVTVNASVSIFAEVTFELRDDHRFFIESADQDKTLDGDFELITGATDLPLVSLLLRYLWHQSWPGLTITMKARSPKGAGLGGSSSLGVALGAGLVTLREQFTDSGGMKSEARLLEIVQSIETELIRVPTGCQDYWGAYRGGVNIIDFSHFGTTCHSLRGEAVSFLAEHLVLCYSGQSRDSAINNWDIFKKAFDQHAGTLESLQKISALSSEVANCFRQGDFNGALEFSNKEWQERVKLWPNIVTNITQRLAMAGAEAGASFSRVCGAGGGGVMAFFTEPGNRQKLAEELTAAGGEVLDGSVVDDGLTMNY